MRLPYQDHSSHTPVEPANTFACVCLFFVRTSVVECHHWHLAHHGQRDLSDASAPSTFVRWMEERKDVGERRSEGENEGGREGEKEGRQGGGSDGERTGGKD